MKPYELVVLLHPDLEIDVDTPIAKLEKLIDGVGGKVTKRDNWGKKRLAYPINKQQFAMYVYFELDLPADKVRELESQLLITEEVIRFLTVNKVVVQRESTATKRARATKPAVVVAAAAEE